MNTLWLRLRAPFAAFRWLQAGVYRATSPILPPSAAWGLLLNLAGIDTRDPREDCEITPVRPDAPPLCIATGALRTPDKAILYQQLHGYRVGTDKTTKALAARTHGAKYWIAPVRRELLVGFDAILGVRSPDADLLQRIDHGLHGRLDTRDHGPRYGLPFAGDNNLLFDRIDLLSAPCVARWYAPIEAGAPGNAGQPGELPGELADDPGMPAPRGSCRLTVAIDRNDSSRTTSVLVAPTEPRAEPPDHAWIWCPRDPGG